MAKDNGQTNLDLKQKGAVATTQFESFEGTGFEEVTTEDLAIPCLLYTSPSPRDLSTSRMPSSA